MSPIRWVVVAAALHLAVVGWAQSTDGLSVSKLPLPVDGSSGSVVFESAAPTAGILTGLLLPTSGALTSWAPVFSVLTAQGNLKEDRSGAWVGSLPKRWVKVAKAGYVFAGMRLLVRISPGPVRIQQIQVFWLPWVDGAVRTGFLEGPILGEAARQSDQVRIIELRLPAGSIPVGLWGQQRQGSVEQVSLLVKSLGDTAKTPLPLRSDTFQAPAVEAPRGPSVIEPLPPSSLLK